MVWPEFLEGFWPYHGAGIDWLVSPFCPWLSKIIEKHAAVLKSPRLEALTSDLFSNICCFGVFTPLTRGVNTNGGCAAAGRSHRPATEWRGGGGLLRNGGDTLFEILKCRNQGVESL